MCILSCKKGCIAISLSGQLEISKKAKFFFEPFRSFLMDFLHNTFLRKNPQFSNWPTDCKRAGKAQRKSTSWQSYLGGCADLPVTARNGILFPRFLRFACSAFLSIFLEIFLPIQWNTQKLFFFCAILVLQFVSLKYSLYGRLSTPSGFKLIKLKLILLIVHHRKVL